MITQYLTNQAYGYPRGAERRFPATHLMCIHITANPSTPPATARQERDYANRPGSSGPSAHDYIDRSGFAIEAIDPAKYVAWSNGVLRSPKTTVPGVQAVVDAVASGKNANECYYREVENCGRYPDYPFTDEQSWLCARLAAEDSLETGIPISRATIHLHSDLDSVNRPNCPVPAATAEAFVAGIIERAASIRTLMELDAACTRIVELEAQILAKDGALETQRAQIEGLQAELDGANRTIATARTELSTDHAVIAFHTLSEQP